MTADEFVFLPLGGAGEIGMNLNLYGFGPPGRQKWVMLDCGVMFGSDATPGVDVIMPDPSFIEERRRDLLGIVLTHAHEDHLGAVGHLWPRLRCPVYATPFTAALLRHKLAEAEILDDVPLKVIPLSGTLDLAPFAIELMSITHSIPEPNAVVVRTSLGAVLHTGDWKIDPDPLIGERTDEAAFRKLGEQGVLAMVCDSTNVFTPGRSGSEADVRKSLIELIGTLKGRVAVTAFASNVARLESVHAAARSHGREVVLAGRAMHKVVAAARECGLLQEFKTVEDEHAVYLPPDKVLYLVTGSQGEPRAALARIADGTHPEIALEPGDAVVYSSRIIPGNERAIFAVHNALAARGIEVITEKDHFVHVSGHPCRDELAEMYSWIRPQISIPVHGEMRHLVEHARFAKQLQVPQSVVAPNGSMVRLAPGRAEIVDEAPSGRLHLDGLEIVDSEEEDAPLRARRSMAFAGMVAVALILDAKGRLAADPVVMGEGIPGRVLAALRDAASDSARGLSRRRIDEAELAEGVRRAVRRAAQDVWGKKPITRVDLAWV